MGERLGEAVGDVVVRSYLNDGDGLLMHAVTDEVVTHVNVLGAAVVDGVFAQIDGMQPCCPRRG